MISSVLAPTTKDIRDVGGKATSLFRLLFRYNGIYMGLRDNHRFYYDWIWWLLRRVYVEKGVRLHRRGLLPFPDDIFFLVRKEIADLASGSLNAEDAAARIASRKAE